MVRALVPVEVLEGETVPPGVLDLLGAAEVVVLGYHVIPEQTTPNQARLSFEEQGAAKLDAIAEAFADAGATVETRLVFTHDEAQTFDRVAGETEADLIVHLNPAMAADDLLVALHGAVAAERIGTVVADLLSTTDTTIHLLEVAGPDADTLNLLDRAERALDDAEIDPARIRTDRVQSDSPVQAIAEAARDVDAIALGERAPDWRELVFGDFEERVAEAALGAVLVVRPDPAGTADGDEA
ncbi:universal stress protein [Halorientalis brevis]|uniref:Universal stress protein n=1 Tax=Halorientalis brevis TaxID=1126241 RepID=A0ABD6CA50_9EURY|nr:universal stress protein [Halorientalis brevis]